MFSVSGFPFHGKEFKLLSRCIGMFVQSSVTLHGAFDEHNTTKDISSARKIFDPLEKQKHLTRA